MKVHCPRCGKKADITANPFRPFCSERCKLLDLGNWLSGGYRIPAMEKPEEEDGTPLTPNEPDKE